MTPYERYHATLNGQPIDHYARIPIVMQFAAEYIGSNYAAFASDHTVLVEANIRCAEDFGFDQVSCISDPYRETEGFGAKIIYHDNGVPECPKPPLADIEELEDLESFNVPDSEQSIRMKDRIDAVRLYKERVGGRYSILGWVEGPAALAGDVRGLSAFLMDLMDEPELCEKLMDLCVETSTRFALAQIEAGADTIGIGDAICSQISPEVYDSLICPRQKQLMDAIQAAGAKVRLHVCGQTKHLWPKMSELPIDIFDCDHMVTLTEARSIFPETVVLAGNLDPVSDLRFGAPETITAKLKACQAEVGSRFMVNAGCEIPSATPEENLKAFCTPLLA